MLRETLYAILSATFVLTACQEQERSASSETKFTPHQKHPLYAIIETPAESPYEKALAEALSTSMVPDALQQICGQWYPEFGYEVADAYVAWRERNKAVLDDLKQRSTEVWTRRAGPDAPYVKLVYPHLRKELVKNLMHQTDAMSVDEFKSNCANYAKDVRGARWNLEERLAQELQVIRERRPDTASPG